MHYYKFLGDGWILFFPPNINAVELVKFLNGASLRFTTRCESFVRGHLKSPERRFGLRFGADKGLLHGFDIRAADEYVGESIVTATLLQDVGKSFETPDTDPLVV